MSQAAYLYRQAWNSLKVKKGLVATVVVTMGTTLGALLCVLTFAHLLLFQSLPYPDDERLYSISHMMSNSEGTLNADVFTYPSALHLYGDKQVFEKTAVNLSFSQTITSLPHQPQIAAGYVTPSWFELLGAKTIHGRLFEPTEDIGMFNPTAIITHETWQKEFDGNKDILTQRVKLGEISYRIIGVLSKDFIEPEIRASARGFNVGIWLPWDYNPHSANKDNWARFNGYIRTIGKLKEQVTVAEAEQRLTPQLYNEWSSQVEGIPDFKDWSLNIELRSLKRLLNEYSQQTLMFLIAGIAGLVIIATTNIANLFISRTAERQRDLSIMAALGAKKSHLFRLLFAESSLLMMVSALLAMIIASLGFSFMQTHLGRVLSRVSELSLNFFTLSATLILTLFFSLLFATIGSRIINYRLLNTQLEGSGKGTSIQVSKHYRHTFVVIQIAIATVIIFANAALFKTSLKTINEPLGFDVDNMIGFTISPPSTTELSQEELGSAMQMLKTNLLQLPQVKSVSQATEPLYGFRFIDLVKESSDDEYRAEYKIADMTYFKQIAQPLLSGSYISDRDIRNGIKNIIVNDVFANALQPDSDVLGMKLNVDNDNYTIVGVVRGVKTSFSKNEDIPYRVYIPPSLDYTSLNIKLEPGQTVTREQITSTIKQAGNGYSLQTLRDLPETKIDQLFTEYTVTTTTAILVLITLFLATIGLYGIISYSTQMRRFEIGARMAIGAKRKHLVSLIVRDNSVVMLIGTLMSVLAMLVIYLFNQELFAEYIDIGLIPVFVLTLLAIGSLALFACYWPLRQYINHPAIHMLRGSD